jgi:hypothetical protein
MALNEVVTLAFSSDYEEIQEVLSSNGLKPHSREHWEVLWDENPLREEGRPIGWLIKSNNQITGFLGSIPLKYYYGDCVLQAVAVHSFAVQFESRGHSVELAAKFSEQESVDLLMNTTASREVGAIMQLFGFEELPVRSYREALWIPLNLKKCAEAFLVSRPWARKYRHGIKLISRIIQSFSTFRLQYLFRIRDSRVEIKPLDIRDIGQQFDVLWNYRDKQALLCDRSAKQLAWHVKVMRHTQEVKLFGAFSQGTLEAYALLGIDTVAGTDLRRCRVVDVFGTSSRQILDKLISAAVEYSKKRGLHVVEINGGSSEARKAFTKFWPLTRSFPDSPFFFRANSKSMELSVIVSARHGWQPTQYDGDTSL